MSISLGNGLVLLNRQQAMAWNKDDPAVCFTRSQCVNSLAPGRCGCYLKLVVFKLVSRINILSISCEIVLRWTPQDLTDDKSTLVQVMAWCRQATSHYQSQCWPRYLSPYGVTRPQWGSCGMISNVKCSIAFTWRDLYKVMFTLPVMKDHLSWETT